MLEFYKFALPRMNRKAKIIFWSMFPIALVSSIVSILIPVVQKNLILGITNGKLDREEIIKICLISFIGIIVNVLEALGLNKLMICLKRKIQQELLNSGIRNDNPIIRDKGAGAYMVSIFGDSEQISGLIQNNVFYIFFSGCYSSAYHNAELVNAVCSYCYTVIYNYDSYPYFIK